MTNVGSRPPSASTDAIRLVVVVLPCVPATAMPCFRRISSASISARGTIGIPRSRAATISGLSGATAVDTTTASAPATFAARVADRDARRRGRARRAVTALAARSDPETLVALRGEHFGDAAHPGAADADEMDALDLVLHRRVPSATQASATRSGGVGARELARRDRHREQRLRA